MQEAKETEIQSLDREGPLKEGMGTHSSVPTRRLLRPEEPGRPQSIESQRVRHYQSDLVCMHGSVCMHAK